MTYHDLIGTHYLQDINQDYLFQDVAAYNQRVMGPAHVENVLTLACRTALSQSGVAQVAIPIDIQAMPAGAERRFKRNVKGHVSASYQPPHRVPDDGLLQAAAELLSGHSRIAILAAGGVAAVHGRLRLDPHLRSISNPRVHAAGDAAAVRPPLTPVAAADAACVAANLLGDPVHEPDYGGVASTVFTIPPLAMSGLTSDQARAQGRDFDIGRGDLSDYHAIRREGLGEAETSFKAMLERRSGRILGAHVFAPFAHETITPFALAIRAGLPAADMAALPAAYPSSASTIASMLG